MIGLLSENLGPQKIKPDDGSGLGPRLVDNADRITKKYHLMAVDNPVGSGYSTTSTGAYVKSEEEMREQFVHAVRKFYEMHPEYKQNPVWVTGESYAGKYVPNIALELAVNATEVPLKGIIVGNGLYHERIQYTTLGDFAFNAGVIDEKLLAEMHRREKQCLQAIDQGQTRAGDFCENITVRWLYTGPDAAAGELFYYDLGMTDASALDTLTTSMGAYLNREDVKAALHAQNATWQCADEVGPVAQALYADFTKPSAPVVAALLETGKEVMLYNGVRDGSVCNHVGNLKSLLSLEWSGKVDFAAAPNKPWPSAKDVMGHVRSARNLRFATVMRTGHLVPTVVPDSYAQLLDMVLSAPPVAPAAEDSLVV
jgi:vitellogenic carboxypeptidase-like protein